MKLLITASISLALAGCAGEAELRSVSGQSAKMLTGYSKSLRDFAAAQSVLNAEAEARILRFEAMRRERLGEIGARVDTWKYLGDEKALQRFEVAGAATADDLIEAAKPQLPPQTLPSLKYDSGEVGQVIKQLVELQKPVTIQQRVETLLTFVEPVGKAASEKIKEAQGQAKAGGDLAAASEASVAAIATAQLPK